MYLLIALSTVYNFVIYLYLRHVFRFGYFYEEILENNTTDSASIEIRRSEEKLPGNKVVLIIDLINICCNYLRCIGLRYIVIAMIIFARVIPYVE